VQGSLGVAAMPTSCRHFPRLYCLDPTGTALTLSHACRTVAGDLDRAQPEAVEETIVEMSPSRLPAPPEGLDGRGVMPPLLAPGVLTSWEALSLWEELAAATLLRRGANALEALAHVVDAAERVRRWRPGEGALRASVKMAFSQAGPVRSGALAAMMAEPGTVDTLRQRIVSDLPAGNRSLWDDGGARPLSGPLPWEVADAGVRRFLASHAWASWPGRMGGGVRTAAANVVVALAILVGELSHHGEPVRLAPAATRTDVLLRHLASPRALADFLSGVETGAGEFPPSVAAVWPAA